MTDLTPFAGRDVTPGWTWRSADGDEWAPASMETRHLFYTIRMIWNHAVPEHMRVGQNIRLYRFPAFYTRAYMELAVFHLGHELMRRRDLLPWQVRELELIASWFREYDWTEVKPLAGPRLQLEHRCDD